jgi:hypothetical protein
MKVTSLKSLVFSIATGALLNSAHAQVLFSDNFDTDSSASWTIKNDSGDGVPDFTVLFAFDYSTNKFVRNGVTNTIPPAPNGGGKGVKMWVNKNDTNAVTAAVSLYPNSQSFSNEYAVKFDMWLNYNGGFQGGSGSTEFATFGVDHSGNYPIWPTNAVNDGVWFAVTGEAGAARDYRSYIGDGGAPSSELLAFGGGFLDRDNDGTPEQEVFSDPTTAPLKQMFPVPAFETDGCPGKQWVQVEIRQRTNDSGSPVITWLMNNYVIAEHSLASAYNQFAGNLMLGNMDPFASIANPKEDNYVIYDNLRVVNLAGVAKLPVITVAPGGDATEPNINGSFVITRAGDLTGPLTVNYRMIGSASNGVDYVLLPGTVTIAAGEASTNVSLTVINDSIGETDETATMFLLSSTNYDLYGSISATAIVHDDNDVPAATVSVTRTNAYELNPLNEGRFSVNLSNPSATDTTINLAKSGTASNGVDYVSIPSSVVIPAGQTNTVVIVTPINNSIIDGYRTVILSVTNGTGYSLGTTNLSATVTIRDDDLPAATAVAFSENFDVDPTANWRVNNGPSDGSADFFFDYSSVGIPPAPNSTGGTTRGLKMQANMANGILSGISVSPNGQSFNGDYRLRFDLWCNFNGPAPAGGAGSTQVTGGGIGTAGTSAQYVGVSDGLFVVASSDGNSTADYRIYSRGAQASYQDASGIYTANSRDNLNAYYAEFGKLQAPAAQVNSYPNQSGTTLVGSQAWMWHDYVITKRGSNVTWTIDNKLIGTVNMTNFTFAGSNISLNQSDINATTSLADPNAISVEFGLIDNVRVEVLPITLPRITSVQVTNSQVLINFTGATNDVLYSFTLESSPTVNTGYTSDPATIVQIAPGSFRATATVSGTTRFYRIRR